MPNRSSKAASTSKSSVKPAETRTLRTGARLVADARQPAKAARVLRHFRMIFNAARNHFRSVELKAGISGSQLWALSIVHANPGAGVTQLARAMSVHQSTASNLVRALIELKLIDAAREADDRRAVQLYATTKGQKVLAKAPAPLTGILPDALMHLDDRVLDRLDRDLAVLAERVAPQTSSRNALIEHDE